MQNEKCKIKNDAARGLLLRQLEEMDFMPRADWDGESLDEVAQLVKAGFDRNVSVNIDEAETAGRAAVS